MSAELHRLFPEGLKHAEAERGKPRHEPPLRFVPTKAPESEQGDDITEKSITVELTDDTTLKVTPYTFSDVESFLTLQKRHQYILDQQDANKRWNKMEPIMGAADAIVSTILATDPDPREITKRKKQVELRDGLLRKMSAIISKAFNLYQQMCSAALRAEWDDIVAEHCFSIGWINEDDETSETFRGQSWLTLAECKRLHLLTVCDQDAAERHTIYMNVTLKKPQRVAVKPFFKRVKELDDLAPSLPCLKDQEDCPPEVERRNISMTPFAMCGLLMRNVSVQIEDEYNCLHPTVPTNPKKLVEQLTKIETKLGSVVVPANDRRKSESQPDESRSKKRAKTENSSRKTNQKRIPRKDQVPTRAEKGCKLCAEYGGAKDTHQTSVCKKWLPGGKPHPEWRGGKTTANINVHQGEHVNQLMAQQAEFQKTILKQMSKISAKKRKKKRSRQRYSDSDSSDSD